MQISASTFSDPARRVQLQQYYDDKKAALYETLKARESQQVPSDVVFKTPDGKTVTGQYIPISAEKMVDSMVSFDKWLELQASMFDNPVVGRAQEQLNRLQANNPDTSSGVRSTFSSEGKLLAYINEDGTAVLSQEAHGMLQPVLDKAGRLGLQGEQRMAYLNQEIGKALSGKYPDLQTARYDSSTSPTKRTFAQMWNPSHDVGQHYQDAMAEALDHYDSMSKWHQQWRANMNEINTYLLGLQEA
ncbi:MAG TPA: hypothetical protein VGN79_11930 [Devosia sp.]|jgi:hypothetical protein|nr:hypothetical protein [Devosia sp.]